MLRSRRCRLVPATGLHLNLCGLFFALRACAEAQVFQWQPHAGPEHDSQRFPYGEKSHLPLRAVCGPALSSAVWHDLRCHVDWRLEFSSWGARSKLAYSARHLLFYSFVMWTPSSLGAESKSVSGVWARRGRAAWLKVPSESPGCTQGAIVVNPLRRDS